MREELENFSDFLKRLAVGGCVVFRKARRKASVPRWPCQRNSWLPIRRSRLCIIFLEAVSFFVVLGMW
jgi:hypothetical protein